MGHEDIELREIDPSGKYRIVHPGSFAAVEVRVKSGDKVKSGGKSMLSMSDGTKMSVHMEGNCCAACCRCCCAGESAFFSHFEVDPESGKSEVDVLLAPACPGDVQLVNVDESTSWRIQSGSFLACDDGVDIGVGTQGCCQGCCSGEGFFVLTAKGKGNLVLESYGSIHKYELAAGEIRKVDNGYLVAWSADMDYKIGMASGVVNSVLSGEGLVCTFTGPGTVYVQTRNIEPFAKLVAPYVVAQAQAQ
eukprot:GFYU01008672.1.p1 GENE.GFYU01008672.1~~GFYU01008672.1.p1  ORF type:complete len:261 (-),score=65.30 GFYU01008672.1:68-811(-)